MNHNVALEAVDVTQVTNETCMCHLAHGYFEEFFHGQHSFYIPAIIALQPVIDDVNNLEHTTPFQINEFQQAMFLSIQTNVPSLMGLVLVFIINSKYMWPRYFSKVLSMVK